MEVRFVSLGPATGALVTPGEIKTRFGVEDNSRDAEFTAWAATITGQLEAFTNNCLLLREVTETLRREYGGPYVVMSYPNVRNLAALTIGGEAQSLADYLLHSSGVLARADGADLPGGVLIATYTAGYDPIPGDLIEAGLECALALDAAKIVPVGVSRESIPDVGDVTYRAPGEGLTRGPTGAHIAWAAAALLSPYKRTWAP